MPYNLTLVSLCLLVTAVTAGADDTQTLPLPSDEMLEFLGQWEKVDGEWMDPTQLQEISMLEADSMKGQPNED